ncbi:hypothetical protein HDU98_003107 [Podochytrium sp. JEL0797]|nr:hypothetical protein HDU98_003107 [Podochytrium sp. JEL0797]
MPLMPSAPALPAMPTPASTPPPSAPSDAIGLPPRPSKEKVDSAVAKKSKEELREEVAKVKKVNFWGWVDVGFSHGVDDYDRTPIEPDPLTREGAIEVLQMRLEMRKVTQELSKWREEYEDAINGRGGDLYDPSPFTDNTTSSPLDEQDPSQLQSPPSTSQNLRRSQSTTTLPGDPTNTQAAMAALLRRYPPILTSQQDPQSTPSKSHIYPHPQYPTHLLPRKKQSAPQVASSSPPKRSQSMPASALKITTTPPIAPVAAKAAIPAPRPRPRPQKSGASTTGGGLFPSWNMLERPHSHAGTSGPSSKPVLHPSPLANQAAAAAASAAEVTASMNGGGGPPTVPPVPRKRDAAFAQGAAAAAASGARWTWNEALARNHEKEVEAAESGGMSAGVHQEAVGGHVKEKSGGLVGGLVGFWRSDKGKE